MSCLWDENLSYLLGQSLWRLEMSKVLGDAPIPEKDFEMGILRCIPEGHTFKGYPMQFQTIHAYRIFQGLVKTKSAKDILLVKGDKVRFGLRVCAFEYGEHGLSVWVMICARFKAL